MEMGTVVFTSTRDGKPQIYTMQADGRKQKRISRNDFSDQNPFWSPDSKKIAFSSDRAGKWNICVMNADGTSPVQLTENSGNNRFPAWSYDGNQIAFQSDRSGTSEVFVMNSDGKALQQLTGKGALKAGKAASTNPSWSYDGSLLFFVREAGGGSAIWKMGKDGSAMTQVTKTKKSDRWPSLSPSGAILLFASDEGDVFQIYLYDENVKNREMITGNYSEKECTEPRWSPTGRNIVFVSGSTGHRAIYRKRHLERNDVKAMQKREDRPVLLTKNKCDDYEPCWGK